MARDMLHDNYKMCSDSKIRMFMSEDKYYYLTFNEKTLLVTRDEKGFIFIDENCLIDLVSKVIYFYKNGVLWEMQFDGEYTIE